MKECCSYINGAWVKGNESYQVIDPGKGTGCATAYRVEPPRIHDAIDVAAQEFPHWSAMPALQRANFLLAIAKNMQARREEMARLLTIENGKPLLESGLEIDLAIDHFRWFAEEARRAYGRIVPNQAPGKRHWVLKRPIGVVGAIAPWNFPVALSARKVAPALASGCTVILRPASQTPLACTVMSECIQEARLPAGAYQMVLADAQSTTDAFMNHPVCRKVSLTGSTPVGKKLIQASANSMTKLSLELGGQAPVLIFADCNLPHAVESAVRGKTRNVGQSCIAANRFYVEHSIYDQFLEHFTASMQALKVGYGLEPVDVGALESQKGLDHALNHINDAARHGARLLCGGSQIHLSGKYQHGFYLAPTVVADVPPEALCMREETFAPVAPVQSFRTDEEAILSANATEFGLAAYAYTSDLNRALHLSEALEAGSIGINDPVPSTSNCPFGGFKQSGWGRELGTEGLEAFLEPVHVSIGGL